MIDASRERTGLTGTAAPAVAATGETEQQAMARLYSHAGWKIFPLWWVDSGRCACRAGATCTSPGKHPLFRPAHRRGEPQCFGSCGRLGHGLYDASGDPGTVAAWWADTPHAGIGLPTQGNGLVVLDVDSKNGGLASIERLAERCRIRGVDLDDTLTQSTGQYPPGRGFHLLYEAPAGGVKGGARNFGADYPGLDIRGRGHYIVAAPTLHVSGVQYQWIDWGANILPWPDLLTSFLNVRIPAPAPAANTSQVTGRGYAAAAFTREVAEVRATKEGNRNNRLHLAAWNLGQLVGAGELNRAEVARELLAAAIATGLQPNPAMATIESGMAAGQQHPRRVRAA